MTVSAAKSKTKPKSKSPSPVNPSPSHLAGAFSKSTATTPAANLSAFYACGPAVSLGSPVQAKLVISRAGDSYEREADAVADRVNSGKTAPSISSIPAGGLPNSALMQETDEEEKAGDAGPQAMSIQRRDAENDEEKIDESSVMAMRVQRRAERPEDEAPESPVAAQRQPVEEETGDSLSVQRRADVDTEEESENQAAMPKRVQRQDEDKKPEAAIAMPAFIQRRCEGCDPTQPIQTKRDFPRIPNLEEQPPDKSSESETEPAEREEAEPSPEEESAEEKTAGAPASKVRLPEIEPYSPQAETPPIQAKSAPGGAKHNAPKKTAGLQRRIRQSQGGGRPFTPGLQSEMERRFGRDLSSVRIHSDAASGQMNRDMGARAFTHGRDIYFGTGEFQPESKSGKHLIAHELTHTVQQRAVGEVVQRYSGPTQDVETEPRPEVPNDGEEVEGRMNEKIENDPDVRDPEDLSEEERREARNPDRGEVRRESDDISASGESTPSVDRGEEAEQKTEKQKSQVEQQVQEQPPEAEKEKEGEGEGAAAELSEAEAAAQRAQQAQARAGSVEIPAEPQPFRHPRIQAPVDSAGEPLPRNSPVDTQVRGLGYIGEMLREKGYEMKRHAAEQEIGSHGLDAVIEKEREDLANAREGTDKMESHNEARKEIAEKSRQAHGESVERQQFVAEKAPDLAAKAEEGQEDSGDLAGEARSKAERSESEVPDDPDARADAEEQSGEMQSAAEGAESMDEAIRQSGTRARQYEQEAQQASEQNQQSETRIGETEGIIEQTGGRIEEMHAANQASDEQIENAAAGPALIRRHSRQTAQSGDELISATIVMEQELNDLQAQYLADMAGIESREDAVERQQREQEQARQPEMSPEEEQLFELAGMNDEEQEQRIAEMDQSRRDGLLATLERMIQEAPDQGAAASEGARLRVDTGITQAIRGEQQADPRAEQIQEVENRRSQRVGGVLDVADRNMNFLTAEQQRMLANRLVAQSITDDISNINVLQMGKQMLKAMVDPREMLAGVVGGFEKMLTGFANIGNWEAWKRDPLGNLLQVAADITTGLATIFSTILGIAGIITALMVALTIISWGFLSPVTGPVIAWMGTIMTYAGWGALIAGGLAVYFNYLSYLKNLHDAGTAETARELFGNTEQMKQNASDGFQGAMAVVEGIGAVKMGPRLSSGEVFRNVPRSPGAWARQTVQGVREGASTLAAMPGRVARGARRLFEGGRRGLVRFKQRLRGLFGRRRVGEPSVARRTGRGPATRSDLPETAPVRTPRDGDLGSFDGQRVRAEVDLPGNQRMRILDDGRCVVCSSPCRYVRQNYAKELADNPSLRQRLDDIEAELARNPNNQVLLNQHRDIQVQLRTARIERPARLRQNLRDELDANPNLARQLDEIEPRIRNNPENRRNQRRLDAIERQLEQARRARAASTPNARRTPRQSELDALAQNPGFEPQVSFKNGRRVRYGERGSSRPDGFRTPPPEALEVKNYDVNSSANRANLYETIQSQYRQRLGNLPRGTKQVFILDLRGQTVSDELIRRMRRNILSVTSSSGAEVRFLI